MNNVSYLQQIVAPSDRGMKKKDLKEAAGLTGHAMLKLRKDQDITTETIGKICKALDCQMTDIMEFVEK